MNTFTRKAPSTPEVGVRIGGVCIERDMSSAWSAGDMDKWATTVAWLVSHEPGLNWMIIGFDKPVQVYACNDNGIISRPDPIIQAPSVLAAMTWLNSQPLDHILDFVAVWKPHPEIAKRNPHTTAISRTVSRLIVELDPAIDVAVHTEGDQHIITLTHPAVCPVDPLVTFKLPTEPAMNFNYVCEYELFNNHTAHHRKLVAKAWGIVLAELSP